MQFKTLQELWGYLLYCPTCQDICRTLEIPQGSDPWFKAISYKKIDQFLFIQFQSRTGKTSGPEIIINCLDNSYTKSDMAISDKYSEISFHIYAWCDVCSTTFATSEDISIIYEDTLVSNIELDSEQADLKSGKYQYNVTLSYFSNVMFITKYLTDKDGSSISQQEIQRPLVKIDFSKPKAAITRIKTLIIFD